MPISYALILIEKNTNEAFKLNDFSNGISADFQ